MIKGVKIEDRDETCNRSGDICASTNGANGDDSDDSDDGSGRRKTGFGKISPTRIFRED